MQGPAIVDGLIAMCGIVGLYIKNAGMEEELGRMFAPMLVEMSDRGPDSAGIAIYRESRADVVKLTVYSPDLDHDWDDLEHSIDEHFGNCFQLEVNSSHCVISTDGDHAGITAAIEAFDPDLQIMSVGRSIEIYKETGQPFDVVTRFGIEGMAGSHAVGHTRMATESAVTTAGSHPFSTGMDICLVHNGSLSNHNRLRSWLESNAGIGFRTQNDTEVAAAYVFHQLNSGSTLHGALEECITELDGFYTFVAGTKDGFASLRDPIACKPAVLAETDDYVAFGSEYRALAHLPGIVHAEVWEPEPAIVYSWGRQ